MVPGPANATLIHEATGNVFPPEDSSILDLIPDATFIVDRTGNATAWNRAMEKLTGTSRSQVLGTRNYMHAIPFFGSERIPLIELVMRRLEIPEQRLRSLTREGETLSMESFVPDLFDGRGGYLRAEASPFYDARGAVAGAVESIRDITERKRLESLLLEKDKQLQNQARQMEEFSIALRIILAQTEKDRSEAECHIMTNLRQSLLPHFDRLRRMGLDNSQALCLAEMESALQDILSPFLTRIASQYSNLTPMEIRIANMVRSGKSSKEIADILNIAEKTVSTHRYNLRVKFGIKNKGTGLRSFLMTLSR
ncbi:MAG: LuxR C-terminal-related transcriptional regulator [Desulfobacteraceae bacterium]|nr:LuxR C-terminal-related transcriptional regulator [Desulfobacteraceae bacterium]